MLRSFSPQPMSTPSIDFYNDAIDAVQTGDLPTALVSAENSLTEDPADSQTWQLYIVILNALGRTEDAIRATEKLRSLGLSDADEHLIKASEAASSNDIPQAIFHYRAALEADPKRPEIHASLALALMEEGLADEALAAARHAVALAPEDSRTNYALGRILRLSGKKDAALAALTLAVNDDPTFMLALYEKGMLLADSGRLTEALAAFRKFLKAQPDNPDAAEAVKNISVRIGGSQTS